MIFPNTHLYFFLKLFFKKIFIYLFIWLHRVLVVACELLVVACMWDLVPQPGIESRPLALGVQSLIHCATRKVPTSVFILF